MGIKRLVIKEWKWLCMLIVASIPVSYALISSGFYEPHDLHHFADIYQMVRAIQSGQIPPRLAPDFSFGYGYPLFNYYYVMPFYLGSVFYFLFGSIQLSFKLVFFSSILISVIGMYLFLREFVGKWSAFSGSMLFLYTPYRAVEIYVRGAMGEAFALSLLPWVFWAVVKLVKNPKDFKIIGVTSLIIVVFTLSHNYLWAMSTPLMFLFVLMISRKNNIKKRLLDLATAGFLSMGMTAYWWLPALVEKRLVASDTPFPLIDHFPFIKQLIVPSWGYGSSVWGPGDGISFQIGIVNLAVFVFAVLVYLFRRKVIKKSIRRMLAWGLLSFMLCFVFMNIRTYPIWKLVPFHNLIQFPWRLLIFTTFVTSILAALVVELTGKSKRLLVGSLVIIVAVFINYNYFRPSGIFYKTDNDYLARFFADRVIGGSKSDVSEEYIQWSEDYLLLPNWTDERPSTLPVSKVEITDGEVIGVVEESSVSWSAEVVADKDTKVVFHSYYFPGWFARVDGGISEINPGKPYGQIETQVSAGKHTIEFFWQETWFRRIADVISMIFALLVIGIVSSLRLRIKVQRIMRHIY